MPTRLRPWHVALLGVALFALMRWVAPAALDLPRTLTADEADTLLGAKLLTEKVALDKTAPLKERLVNGFATTATHPRLAVLPPDKTAPRAALEAPLPRWLGALGIGVLPTSAAATNLERASTPSALAVALALCIIAWRFRARGLLAAAFLVVTPGVLEAAASPGYGASAILVMALFAALLDRALARGGAFATAALGPALGLAMGVHPAALALWVAVLVAWAIRHRPAPAPADPAAPGTLRLPTVPLALFVIPIVALVVLVVSWPTLWSDTGKRLGAWLVDWGSAPSAPQEVLGLAFDQATARGAPAFTALVQWVAWTPLPLIALWLVGVARALREGRDGAWAPIVALAVLLLVGAIEGGLFGARLSLLALCWVPLALTAAAGAQSLLMWLARFAPAARSRDALVLALVLALPLYQTVRGTTLGMARQTGAELRQPVPRWLLREAAARRPMGVLYAGPGAERLLPGVDAAREGEDLELRSGALAEAELALVVTASGAEPPPELAARLQNGRELARDPRPGLLVSLWDLAAPAPLDKRPALPHN